MSEFPDARARESTPKTYTPARDPIPHQEERAVGNAVTPKPHARAREACPLCELFASTTELGHRFGYEGPAQRCASCVGAQAPEPARKRTLPHDAVPAFVRDVLVMVFWQSTAPVPAGRTFVDGSASRSPTASVLRQLELGCVGDGNRGTRGTWRGEQVEPVEVRGVSGLRVDPAALARLEAKYDALPPKHRATADVVIAMGETYDPREKWRDGELSYLQRLGLELADEETRARWSALVLAKDSGPMRTGSEELGETRLREAARAWWTA